MATPETIPDFSKMIRNFIELTGVSVSEATRRLEEVEWEYELAVCIYTVEKTRGDLNNKPDSVEVINVEEEYEREAMIEEQAMVTEDVFSQAEDFTDQHSGCTSEAMLDSGANVMTETKNEPIKPETKKNAFRTGRPHIVTLETLRLNEERKSHTEGDGVSAFHVGGSLTRPEHSSREKSDVERNKRRAVEEPSSNLENIIPENSDSQEEIDVENAYERYKRRAVGESSSDLVEVIDQHSGCTSEVILDSGANFMTKTKNEPIKPETKKLAFGTGGPHIVTLDTLRLSEERESHSEDDDVSAFYAGGSVTSGQQILEPEKKKVKKSKKKTKGKDESHRQDLVQDIFRAAMENGAEPVTNTTSHEDSLSLIFRGRRTTYPSVAGTNEGAHEEAETTDEQHEVYLRTWNNGFTIDDGELQDYDTVENRAFLMDVSRGEIPAAIYERHHSGEIFLNLQDHSTQDYIPPKKILLPFSGIGHRLGSPTPNVAENQESEKSNLEKAEEMMQVNNEEPVTRIHVRLADSSRLIIWLNHTHTIRHLREFIVVARPEYSASIFSLVSHASIELTDDSATLKEADLLNSVVVQRLSENKEE